jgi:hypothetical protein
MPTASASQGSFTDLTITLASLATASWRESSYVDHAAIDAIDYSLGGKITVGTTPSANTAIELWLYGQINGTPEYTGGATGVNAATTPTGDKSLLIPLDFIIVNSATSNVAFRFGPYSVLSAFGVIPARWGLWVLNNSGVALHATGGNHKITYQAVNFVSA